VKKTALNVCLWKCSFCCIDYSNFEVCHTFFRAGPANPEPRRCIFDHLEYVEVVSFSFRRQQSKNKWNGGCDVVVVHSVTWSLHEAQDRENLREDMRGRLECPVQEPHDALHE